MLKTKLQPGTKVRCVDNSNYRFLTKDKVYEVIEPTTQATKYGVGLFDYLDDDGDVLYYSGYFTEAERFEIVEEPVIADKCSTKDLTFKKKEVSMQSISKEPTPDAFQVGDVVWCILYGKGEVTSVSTDSDPYYHVNVKYDCGGHNWYTVDGRLEIDCPRVLFFSEPKIEASVTRPFVPSLVGKTVAIVPKYDEDAIQVLTVIGEDAFRIFTSGAEVYWDKDRIKAIYEVSSKNLLKK